MKKPALIFLFIGLFLIENSVSAHDTRSENQLDLAKDLYRRAKYDESISKCKTSLSYGPRGDAHYLMALCLIQKNQYQDAIEALQKAKECKTSQHPAEADLIYFYLGKCRLELGKTEEAIKDYLEAVSIEPSRAPYFQALGIAYEKAGKEKEANEAKAKADVLLEQQKRKKL